MGAVTKEDLGDSALAGELHDRAHRIFTLQHFDVRVSLSRQAEVGIHDLIFLLSERSFVDVDHKQLSMEAIGIAAAARNH